LVAGEDPETDYYLKNNLASAYLTDLQNNVAILSLQGEGRSDVFYIPSSYVTKYPDIGGVPYRVMALGINLGAIPDSLNLSNVITKLEADIKELVGIDAVAKPMVISPTTLLTTTDAATLEAARQANIGTAITDYTRYVQTRDQLVTALDKIHSLELYILNNKVKLGLP
jgi:hypothetical protein